MKKWFFLLSGVVLLWSCGSSDKGELVGVLFGGYSIAGGATKAVHAKFLRKMYDEEINP